MSCSTSKGRRGVAAIEIGSCSIDLSLKSCSTTDPSSGNISEEVGAAASTSLVVRMFIALVSNGSSEALSTISGDFGMVPSRVNDLVSFE